ncbi:MAG: acylhydrolase [Bacteroidales bacterium]|nr:acylhydrolase [Bacteroidales bacterium]
MKKTLIAIAAVALLALSAFTAKADDPVADWANFNRYKGGNEAINFRPKAVLMGDSIFDGWARQDTTFFVANNFVGRGISGQTTAKMLVRFRCDVIAHHPKYVVIMAGTNDIAQNDGWNDIDHTLGNIISMCELAKANKIKVVLCTVTPADKVRWRPSVENVHGKMVLLNEKIKAYAAENHIPVADFAAALADEKGVTAEKYSGDSVHPNLDGYKVMGEVLLKYIR